jgi:SNF2 family DNA or RNA helicase
VANFVERIHNVQDRSDVPQPKRRKTIAEGDNLDPTGVYNSAGGGILGQYVQDKREEGRASPSGRGVETVDLTNGDASLALLSRMKVEEKDEEVCLGMIEGAMVNCHRVPSPKPGTMSIGGNDWWPQVKVVLRRKTNDQNLRIFVYDHTRQIFGLVDSKTANGLAPLLDSTLQIRTDCRIPSRRRQPDEQLGQPISRQYKFELMVYSPRKYARQIGRFLSSRMLSLISPVRVEAGVKVFNPHSKEAKMPTTPRYNSVVSEGSPFPQPPPVLRTAEEIRSEVMGLFDSLTRTEDLPELEPDARILTELLKHQKQALFFMTKREEGDEASITDNTSIINSSWQQKKGANGDDIFYNVITGQSQREPPPPTLGGILADMMGLGKTLSVLSLITKTLDRAAHWASLPPCQPKAPEKKQAHPSKHFDVPKAQGLGLTPLRQNGKTTLLICPLSTITNWEEQIKQHVQTGSLTYHIYHGPNRVKDAGQLSQFDLVITTYGSVSSELTSRHRGKRGPFPLEEIGWFRIVLDEAHMIREQSTLQFKAVCRLQACRRWAVTGTPVQNRLDDLAALLAFLRLKPFDDKSKFLQYIVLPFKNADTEIVPKLRILVDTITLRRLKDKIDLPPRTDHIIKLQFSEDEQRIYNLFAKNAQDRVQVLTGQGRDRILGGKTYIHILQSILRLRLICAHGKELLSDDDMSMLQGMSADAPIDLDSDDEEDKPALQESKAYELLDLMIETNNDLCVKCGKKLSVNEASDTADIESERQEDILGYMTPCFHVYCPSCVDSFRDVTTGITRHSNAFGYCPVCSGHVKFSVVELRHTRADVEHESQSLAKGTTKESSGKTIALDRYGGPHTKTRALVEDLLASQLESAKNPDEPPIKSVVFSGWTSHLDLIQIALDNVGITYTRLDGKMSRPARTAAMDTFREDPSVSVILVSIMAGGLGLNLTSASNVYVMEPQYNPAAEAQAVDRVHRLGQRRPVRTVRYIMRDSFEEKMLELQDKKVKLASLSLDGRDKDKVMDRTDAARQRLMDLRSLFK